MNPSDYLKKYPSLIPALKEAGILNRSHILSIDLNRESKKESLPFIRGPVIYKENTGVFIVKTKTHIVRISVKFYIDAIKEYSYTIEEIDPISF